MLSKADALRAIQTELPSVGVLPLKVISYREWISSGKDISVITDSLQFPLIVRSSSYEEDSVGGSNAGAFESIANVNSSSDLIDSIDRVFKSYSSLSQCDQVLIQPYLNNCCVSGVLFTRDPNTGGHYFVINYDDESGKTNSITSGGIVSSKTLYIARGDAYVDGWIRDIVDVAWQLTGLFREFPLDIEFAITETLQVLIFQCRPLQLSEQGRLDIGTQTKRLQQIERKIARLSKRHPYLLGDSAIFGVMPDWNPAEIIGIRPKPLALSLYKELITDSIWAYQRDNYGYRNLRSFPLLTSFAGQPYIDVRVSFNSFIPKMLDDSIGEKLVNHYIRTLQNCPALHDKIEFEIVFSCFTFDLHKKTEVLKNYGFVDQEIEELINSLRLLTNNVLQPQNSIIDNDLNKIRVLEDRQKLVLNSDLNKLERVYWLVEDCKRYGTLPFAGLARGAFIAVQLLNSLVDEGLLTTLERDDFLASLNTVSGEMLKDFACQDQKEFLAKYGHLRPGTYDINSLRYDEAPEKYFAANGNVNSGEEAPECRQFKLTVDKLAAVNSALKRLGLEVDVIELFGCLRKAIEGREWAKFVFTRSISDTLVLLEQLGEDLGFSRSDMAYVNIKDILKLYSDTFGAKATLEDSIRFGKESYLSTLSLALPPVICHPADVWKFDLLSSCPNYVTQKSVIASTCNPETQYLEGKIVFIEAADPGYDWLFSRNIAGLVTQYGGANSHMAIRAGELSIPAVIGAGESSYHCWKNARKLRLDCQNRMVEPVF